MPIRLIAVDMDGTFLDDRKEYDRNLFLSQYNEMKRKGIKFAVASGNQYYQLISFFPEIKDEIAFVAENGAYIVDSGKEIFCGELEKASADKVIKVLESFEGINFVICGKQSAYVKSTVSDNFISSIRHYYHKLMIVEDLYAIEDRIFKLCASVPKHQAFEYVREYEKLVGGMVTPVSSGSGFIDFIIPRLHKANGIGLLQSLWNIGMDETAAFGDGSNDLEMLKSAKYSFAMENGQEIVKSSAQFIAPSNNNKGVLKTIDEILKGKYNE